MVVGVSEGFSKKLESIGVGYKAEKRPSDPVQSWILASVLFQAPQDND
jgi:ribosomal protein L6P/L9E